LETVACNLCGSNDHTPVYKMPDAKFFPDEVFTVVECNRCGLGFVNPRPTFGEMAKYYPAAYYQPESSPSFERYLAKRFAAEASYLRELERRPGPRKLLDVGCLNGEFPRFMLARGWTVEGVEVSAASQRILDFPVYTKEFDEIPVDEPTYDAVTAWAVLEHVHDPMAYFHKASRVLKPGGFFVFLVTNFHSIASRHLFAEDTPRHLYFFTRETVAQYLQKNNFALVREDNGRSVYKLAPEHWLAYLLQTRLRKKPFTYADVPLSSRQFRRAHRLDKGIATSLRYLAYSPVSVIERLLLPAVEAIQVQRKTYGISTYVAQKL
jgi:SAM-dependent methyltransferase